MTGAARRRPRPGPASAGSAARQRVPERAGAGQVAEFSAVVARAGVAHSEGVPEVARWHAVLVAQAGGVPVARWAGAPERHAAHWHGAVAQVSGALARARLARAAPVARDGAGSVARAALARVAGLARGAVCSAAGAGRGVPVRAGAGSAGRVPVPVALAAGSAGGPEQAVAPEAAVAPLLGAAGSAVAAPRRTAVAVPSGCSDDAGPCPRPGAGLGVRAVPVALPGGRAGLGVAGCTSAAVAVTRPAGAGAVRRPGRHAAGAGSASSVPGCAVVRGTASTVRLARASRVSGALGAAPSRFGRSRRGTRGYVPQDAGTGAQRRVPRPASRRPGSPVVPGDTGARSSVTSGEPAGRIAGCAGWASARGRPAGVRMPAGTAGSSIARCAATLRATAPAGSSGGSPRATSVPGRHACSRSGCGGTQWASGSGPQYQVHCYSGTAGRGSPRGTARHRARVSRTRSAPRPRGRTRMTARCPAPLGTTSHCRP